MSRFVFKMPDLGEGTVEAEIVAWHAGPGDSVEEDQLIVEVMTDKAAVEVPSPVSGRVTSTHGTPGDRIAVGSPLIVFETDASDAAAERPGAASGSRDTAASRDAPAVTSAAPARAPRAASNGAMTPGRPGRVMASPANRRRAREAGIDLATVPGSGPGGRILSSDLAVAVGGAADAPARRPMVEDAPATRGMAADRLSAKRAAAVDASPASRTVAEGAPPTTEIKIIGVRRVIAERMTEAKRTIPHFAYVEEVDVTELERLRQHLNSQSPAGAPGLTYLPLVIAALTRALDAFPQCNVLHDAARGVLVRHRAVHVGVATQTPDGLKVPVVRNAQARSLWDLAAEVRRVSERARGNKATRDELSGSTITVTSLGKLGGIASTPVINAPEVAIVGLNKAVERPVVLGGAVVVRRIMNLSSSFDHRFVDGYDAAAMIQALKEYLEHPATIFIPKVTP